MERPERPVSPIRHAFIHEQGLLGFGAVGGGLLFVILSGLAVWLWPFGRFAQVSVLLHTALGLVAALAFALWQLRHWLAARQAPRDARKVSAYAGFWLLALCAATGVVLTGQGLFGRYIGHLWDRLHLWTGLLALPFLVHHLWPPAGQRRGESAGRTGGSPPDWGAARRRTWRLVAGTASALLVLCAALTGSLAVSGAGRAPSESGRPDPGDHPFAPSHADTGTGRPLPVALLAHSGSCGTADCHQAVTREWQASAHHWSAEDAFFQQVRAATTEVKGPQETEKCGACHDPVSLLSGQRDPTLGRSAAGYREGGSCVVCHAVSRVDERGIGSYVVRAPQPYLYERAVGGFGQALNHFLIRAYPAQHDRDYDLTLLRKPESCAPCHKEFDVINPSQGPVQVETQYEDWKQGKWNTDPKPAERLYCQQCHMYFLDGGRAQADAYDLKEGLGSRHRNHYFAAGNQYMPPALASADAAGQAERVEKWLQGKTAVPEIARVWPQGPILQLRIAGPATARAGQHLSLEVRLSNAKVGHSFPTGPLNIGRAWIELVVRDGAGRTIFHSGLLDAQNHIEEGAYVLKPLAIDAAGHMVMEADLWRPVGPRYRPAILPGKSDAYAYAVRVPPGAPGPLSIRARLLYRKANQPFMNAVYPGAERQAPVTDIASGQAEIGLR